MATIQDAIKTKQGLKNFNLEVRDKFEQVKKRGFIPFKYEIRQKKEEEENVYNLYLEQNPKKHVGPQHYWKMPKQDPRKKPTDKFPDEEDGAKTYYLDRKKTDKRVYKPMKGHIF